VQSITWWISQIFAPDFNVTVAGIASSGFSDADAYAFARGSSYDATSSMRNALSGSMLGGRSNLPFLWLCKILFAYGLSSRAMSVADTLAPTSR